MKNPPSQIDYVTFVYLLSQAYDIALLSQNSRPCHMAGDMAEKNVTKLDLTYKSPRSSWATNIFYGLAASGLSGAQLLGLVQAGFPRRSCWAWRARLVHLSARFSFHEQVAQ